MSTTTTGTPSTEASHLRTRIVLAATLLLSALAAAPGQALADAGVGACAAGAGVSLSTSAAAGPYVGANVGLTNSTTGVFTERAAYEAECCAEAREAPDCFRPAA